MEPIKFHRMVRAIVKQDRNKSFSVTCGSNMVALTGSATNIILMELLAGPKYNDKFLHSTTRIPISTVRFTAKLLGSSPIFAKMHEKCAVQESQELVLDPMYVGAYCCQPLAPQNVETFWAPLPLTDDRCIIAALTSFGTLDIYGKRKLERSWHKVMANVHRLYQTLVYPIAGTYTPTDNFEELRNVVNTYWITAFAWHPDPQTRIIFTGNARGEIVAFQLNDTYKGGRLVCIIRTDMERLTCLTAVGQGMLLVTDARGLVDLYAYANAENGSSMKLQKTDSLWKRADRMTLKKACHLDDPNGDGYILMYAKGAHLIAHLISTAGEAVQSCTKYVGGIRITDISAWPPASCIVSTSMRTMYRAHVVCRDDKLTVDLQGIDIDYKSDNFEMLGAGGTVNTNMWFVLYSRMRDGDNRKWKIGESMLVLYRTNGLDVTKRLAELDYTCLNLYEDYAMELKVNLIQNKMNARQSRFADLTEIDFVARMADQKSFLKNLRLELMMTEFLLPVHKFDTYIALKEKQKFLLLYIAICHIFMRLQYLVDLQAKQTTLTKFQQLSAACMTAKYSLILNEFNAFKQLESTKKVYDIEKFVSGLFGAWAWKGFAQRDLEEKCAVCQEPVKVDTLMCAQQHTVARCSLSYVQLSLFDDVSCIHCDCRFHGNCDDLKSLYPEDHLLTCMQCSYVIPDRWTLTTSDDAMDCDNDDDGNAAK